MFSWKRGIAGACLWMVTSIAAFSALPAGAQSPDSTVTPMPTGEVTPKEPGGSPSQKLSEIPEEPDELQAWLANEMDRLRRLDKSSETRIL